MKHAHTVLLIVVSILVPYSSVLGSRGDPYSRGSRDYSQPSHKSTRSYIQAPPRGRTVSYPKATSISYSKPTITYSNSSEEVKETPQAPAKQKVDNRPQAPTKKLVVNEPKAKGRRSNRTQDHEQVNNSDRGKHYTQNNDTHTGGDKWKFNWSLPVYWGYELTPTIGPEKEDDKEGGESTPRPHENTGKECRSTYNSLLSHYVWIDHPNAVWQAYQDLSAICKDWFGPEPVQHLAAEEEWKQCNDAFNQIWIDYGANTTMAAITEGLSIRCQEVLKDEMEAMKDFFDKMRCQEKYDELIAEYGSSIAIPVEAFNQRLSARCQRLLFGHDPLPNPSPSTSSVATPQVPQSVATVTKTRTSSSKKPRATRRRGSVSKYFSYRGR